MTRMNIQFGDGEKLDSFSIQDEWERIRADPSKQPERFLLAIESAGGLKVPDWWAQTVISRKIRFWSNAKGKIPVPFFMTPKEQGIEADSAFFSKMRSANEIEDIDFCFGEGHLIVPGCRNSDCMMLSKVNQHVFIATYDSQPRPFRLSLHVVDKEEPVWETQILSDYSPPTLEGRSFHRLRIYFDLNGYAWIFGMGPEIIYVQSIRVEDAFLGFAFIGT